jgi:hypothetical protein
VQRLRGWPGDRNVRLVGGLCKSVGFGTRWFEMRKMEREDIAKIGRERYRGDGDKLNSIISPREISFSYLFYSLQPYQTVPQ